MSTGERLTERERLLWHLWLALIAFLVVGSFLLTGLAMYFGSPPVVETRPAPSSGPGCRYPRPAGSVIA